MAASIVPDMLVTYGIKAEIDTSTTGTATYSPLCAGIENLQEALNEAIQQYFFMCGNGFATNYVTGMAPAYTLTGRRIVGDAAQEFIFGAAVKFGLMAARQTTLKLTKRSATTGKNDVITCPVTLCNLTDLGGATTDGSAINIELRFDGAPTITQESTTV